MKNNTFPSELSFSMKCLLLLILLIFSFNSSIAASNKQQLSTKTKKEQLTSDPREFPRGCQKVGFHFDDGFLILNPAVDENQQTIYLLHNISHKTIELSVKKDPSQLYFPVYKNRIGPNQWGAFATDHRYLKFFCKTSSSNKIDCGLTLEVCQYTRAKFSYGNMGNYWAISSDTMKKTKHAIIKQGILLRW